MTRTLVRIRGYNDGDPDQSALEYLLGRIDELQNRLLVGQLSPCFPINGTPIGCVPAVDRTLLEPKELVRRRFMEIAGLPLRSASAPVVLRKDDDASLLAPMDEVPSRGSLFSPQPRKAGSVQFTMPFLPPATDVSRLSTSPAESACSATPASGPPKPGKRKRGTVASGASHHNLPWTEEEKRRLAELLAIYPEEEVQARRYAKIAAAIGTRTPGQVANRVNKLLLKQRKRADEKIDPGDDIDDAVGDAVRQSAEYRRYQRLRQQIGLLEANPATPVHAGFRCDDCGVEPIVGVRWRCTKCHEPQAVDLCEECYETGEFSSPTHRPDHRFIRHSS
jgi:hypothetical protein